MKNLQQKIVKISQLIVMDYLIIINRILTRENTTGLLPYPFEVMEFGAAKYNFAAG